MENETTNPIIEATATGNAGDAATTLAPGTESYGRSKPSLPIGGARGLSFRGCPKQSCQLNVYDYLADIPENVETTDLVEVQFKNTRKGYYHNINHLPLEKGDIVAVEASPGHDIGTVTLTGKLVLLQIKRTPPKNMDDIKNVYRKARPVDMEKYAEAKAREHDTMIRSRQIAKELGLEMKIGDVEYQGDGNKAIFYYIADGRVDFRQLIKVLAEVFRVRIEMKQIGARQEAGRIGGFGPCGRELCCTTWMKNFVSVSTTAARYQDLSLNPQKLAGQCAKLKCCMNFEVDQYVEASRRLPSREIALETADGTFYFFKADILSHMITYSTDKRIAANLSTISAERAMEIIALNKEGKKPLALDEQAAKEVQRPVDLATQEDLTRFDKTRKKKKKKKKPTEDSSEQPQQQPRRQPSEQQKKQKAE
ncbi:MAG: hypothetical protein K6A32_08305 [Bacteroidales bacterium]|nr:hypothetical protein [Bacteroidales bacterium]